jgi:ABC-2 type transport system ATP-binding protein
VDPQSREGIFMTIRAAADSGVAVLYSTHYMEEVERMCDRAFLIDRGKLIAQGTVAQLNELGGQLLAWRLPSKSRRDPDGMMVCRV